MRINAFTPNIAFQAYKSKFSEHLEERLAAQEDLKNDAILSNEFRDVFKKHYSRKYYMGQGCFNTVYKIDDFYVMRIPGGDYPNKVFFKRQANTVDNKLASQLSCYYGNPIANFGDIQILKNALEDKQFVQAGTFGLFDYFSKIDYFKNKYLPAFAKLPQKAYNNLAKDIKFLLENNYSFDMYNPNNFIQVDDEIRVVDDITRIDDISITSMYKPFICTLLKDACSIREFDKSDYKNMQAIIKKSVIGMQNAGLDWDIHKNLSNYSDILHAANIEASIIEIYKAVEGLKNEDEISRVLDGLFSKK